VIPVLAVGSAFTWTTCFMVVGLLLAFIRLLRGPSLCDRIVALDLMMTLSVGIIGLRSIQTGQSVFLSVIAVMALIAFLGTIGFVYYVGKRISS